MESFAPIKTRRLDRSKKEEKYLRFLINAGVVYFKVLLKY